MQKYWILLMEPIMEIDIKAELLKAKTAGSNYPLSSYIAVIEYAAGLAIADPEVCRALIEISEVCGWGKRLNRATATLDQAHQQVALDEWRKAQKLKPEPKRRAAQTGANPWSQQIMEEYRRQLALKEQQAMMDERNRQLAGIKNQLAGIKNGY